ncbi:MAG: VanW family protein [Clostridium sp.]
MEKNKKSFGVKEFVSKNKKYLIAGLAVVIAIGAGGAAYGASIKSEVEAWQDKVYPGVTVGGVDLSGKTKEEATTLLTENYVDKINDKKIIVSVEDKKSEISYSKINPSYDIEKATNEAISYGKEDSIFSQKSYIKNKDNKKYDLELSFSYDEETLSNIEKEIKSKVNVAPKDAKLSIDGGKISITPEVNGLKINDEKLTEALKGGINGKVNEETVISLEYETATPKVTAEALSKVNGILGTHQTSVASSTAERKTNVSVATGFANGTLLMPGEIFSFSDASQTDKSKYKEAPVYSNGKVETDIGGGICQVSTTLYRAVMKANIRSVERRNHSMTVGYSEPGLDATIAWGYIDYKFKNTYDSPIYIEGKVVNNQVIFNIYGNVEEKGNRTYDMANEIIKTIPPTVKTIDDPNLEEGKTVTESRGMTGYVVKSYQITYENGKEISRELIATDTYQTTDTVIRKGTKKVAPTPPTTPPAEAPAE